MTIVHLHILRILKKHIQAGEASQNIRDAPKPPVQVLLHCLTCI